MTKTKISILNKDFTEKTMLNLHATMRRTLPGEILNILTSTGRLSEKYGYNIFVVGGFVRDMLLGVKNYDIDIVLEGDAVKFGRLLAGRLKGKLIVYKNFGTSTVLIDWPKGFKKPAHAGSKLKIDLATARRETYEKPAALPTVRSSSLRNDLLRRDFSINAMAVSLNRKDFGELLDFFNGLNDLKNKKIHVLHNASFIDDPTRIFRAVRFEQRYAFRIDEYTAKLIKSAVKEKMFSKTQNQRIRNEIMLMLKEQRPYEALKRMMELHELRFIHKGIIITEKTGQLFKKIHNNLKWYKSNFSTKNSPDAYLMYLAVLSENLSLPQVRELCDKFVFRRVDRIRLIECRRYARSLLRALSSTRNLEPSEIYKMMNGLSRETVLLLRAKSSSRLAQERIVRFLKYLSNTKIKLCGNDLKKIGLKTGPRFKKILNQILYAKLDRKVYTKRDEIRFLKQII